MFELAYGTITGQDHVIAYKNNQDAYSVAAGKNGIVAVVTDGCSSEKFSEFGAAFAASFLAKRFYELILLTEGQTEASLEFSIQKIISLTSGELLENVEYIASQMKREPKDAIQEYFLFTVVAACVTPSYAIIISCGDGAFAVNGEITILKNEILNEPAYITYELLSSKVKPELKIQKVLETANLDSLMIATDGILHLIKSEDKKMPMGDDKVGPVSEFWTSEKYFRNPDMVRRKLALINSIRLNPDWDNETIKKDGGYLPDDTTLITMRRKEKPVWTVT